MANIMINSYCNLKCPYCFAEGEINSCDENNMSLEDFETIISYHKKNNIKVMRIIGGEPTIHPNFEDFLYRILGDDFFEGVHVFSNMTFNDKIRGVILDVASEKRVTMLPNFNDQSISKEKFEIIKNNVKIMSKFKIVETIGINIYKPTFDFEPLIEILKETPIKEIRWAITTPNFKVKEGFDVKKHFNSYFETLVKFFTICNENGYNNHQDCNSIPMCSFDDKQLRTLLT
ncbi:MAG: radical SAM protein, partial [Fusobacteriaceae bacterium]